MVQIGVSTGYSIFEKDQVLTHDQLNSVASYLDDQDRLTRVCLVGVGIFCGLRPKIDGTTVLISKGGGVTTAGDLLRVPAGAVFDQFRIYDDSAPKYPPFYVGEAMVPAYELVLQDVVDVAAKPLAAFGAETGKSLDTMVALLLMESFIKDDDICSGTDCDNLGDYSMNTPRVILIDPASVGPFLEKIETPADVYATLKQLTADRPSLSTAIDSATAYVSAYRAVCDGIQKAVADEFEKLAGVIPKFFADIPPVDPKGWISTLSAINSKLKDSGDVGIQYYYDALKDIVETFNSFRGLLFEDRTLCCPSADSFPKHLLLGNLTPGANPDENRTGFYPSEASGQRHASYMHASFLLGKLDALINDFQLPAGEQPIRITPSMTEEVCLEDRAIPYYYAVKEQLPIQRLWSYSLTRRRMETFNYSYNAGLFKAQGGAANPFAFQIGRFSFFRIEGHLGWEVTKAKAELEKEIKDFNLPITVEAIMAGRDRTKIFVPPFRYTDLHRLHYLIRNDVSQQLDEVGKFSESFKDQVIQSPSVPAPAATSSSPNPKKIADDRNTAITAGIKDAKLNLQLAYTDYQPDRWTSSLSSAVTTASQFKSELGSFVKTDFNTPFDSAITSRSGVWLEWLDKILGDKQSQAEEKVLFSKFIDQHPGLEHFGGVTRGGTFVLIYDENKKVVGDCMLPYTCCDIAEPQPPEPTLPPPKTKPDLTLPIPGTIYDGIRIIPSLDKFWDDKFDDFKTKLPTVVDPGIDWSKNIKVLSDSVISMRSTLEDFGKLFDGAITAGGGAVRVPDVENPVLHGQLKDIVTKQGKIDVLREKLLQPNLPAKEATLIETQIKTEESDLAKTLASTATFVATSGVDVSKGSDGFVVMSTVSSGLAGLKEPSALKILRGGLRTATNATGVDVAVKDMLNTMLKR